MTEKRQLIECGRCKDFEKPVLDHPNRLKPGKCLSFERGKAKTNKQEVIDKAYKARGNCPFLYCTKRYCQMFKPKDEQ